MIDFDDLSNAFSGQTVLCVGDLMLDEFVYGEISRISPEAPAPVIAVQRSETNVGGAASSLDWRVTMTQARGCGPCFRGNA
jgi:D-beta-D-heptose 7-phosphate kinase / D-beta-D-heptose 1-phosphate adenosyltransferase